MTPIKISNTFISIILLITANLITSCSTGISHSAPPKLPAYEEIELEGMSQKNINEKLLKLQNAVDEEYRISTGDEFDIYVYDNPDLTTRSVLVMPDGSISMELVGVVEIGGKTLEEATEAINAKLRKYIHNPQATIIPQHVKSSTITINGSVVNPGVYEIKSGYRVTDAVAEAQGFLQGERDGDTIDMANLDLAFILRDKQILPVDFEEIFKEGNFLNNIPLHNGDYIYIPSVMNLNVFILGAVFAPGYCAYKDNLTVMKALAWSKGRKPTSSSTALVVRGKLVKPTVFKVNVEDILRGRAPDFRLKPNDILYFPTGSIDNYNLTVEKIIPTFEVLNLLAGPFGSKMFGITPK